MAKGRAELVPAESYPPLLAKSARMQAMAALRSNDTLARADRALAAKQAELHGAVLALVSQLEPAMRAQDWPSVFAVTHEIRGLAGTAGLGATGSIANGFCHYLDAIARLGLKPDAAVAGIHLDAVLRSARTTDDTARHGDAVAAQLSALVRHKLSEVKDSARR